jgi:hypothetical protein
VAIETQNGKVNRVVVRGVVVDVVDLDLLAGFSATAARPVSGE